MACSDNSYPYREIWTQQCLTIDLVSTEPKRTAQRWDNRCKGPERLELEICKEREFNEKQRKHCN